MSVSKYVKGYGRPQARKVDHVAGIYLSIACLVHCTGTEHALGIWVGVAEVLNAAEGRLIVLGERVLADHYGRYDGYGAYADNADRC